MLELGYHDDRVEVIPPGVDPRFTPGGAPSPTPLVVGVGRLVPVKRFDRLIRAVVAARKLAPDLTLQLVGTGPDRNALRELVALARRRELRHVSRARLRRRADRPLPASVGGVSARRSVRAGG